VTNGFETVAFLAPALEWVDVEVLGSMFSRLPFGVRPQARPLRVLSRSWDELAIDAAEHLIQVPSIAAPIACASQPTCVLAAERECPKQHRPIGCVNTAFDHHFLQLAKAETESEVQPHAVDMMSAGNG
jgi:hypothetical protein